MILVKNTLFHFQLYRVTRKVHTLEDDIPWQDCDCEIVGPDTTIALTCLVFLIYHIAIDKGYNAICFPSYITWYYKCCYVITYISWASLPFYPRPVLAFGFCRLWVCVHRPWYCQCYNLSSILAIIAKSGPEMQSTLVKIPVVLRIDWHWSLRSKLTLREQFTPLWSFPQDKSPPIDARTTKFGRNTLVKIHIVCDYDWHWASMYITFKTWVRTLNT